MESRWEEMKMKNTPLYPKRNLTQIIAHVDIIIFPISPPFFIVTVIYFMQCDIGHVLVQSGKGSSVIEDETHAHRSMHTCTVPAVHSWHGAKHNCMLFHMEH